MKGRKWWVIIESTGQTMKDRERRVKNEGTETKNIGQRKKDKVKGRGKE